MRPLVTLLLATSCALLPVAALADSPVQAPAACSSPGSIDCPSYERYENRKFGFTVDLPTFFTRRPPDADGRGQPFEYGGKARVRAWASTNSSRPKRMPTLMILASRRRRCNLESY